VLPTFVIGLREGLEAALIVGIIAAFLRKQGRRDLLRWVFIGVSAAILLCLGVGIALEVLSRDLPQKQQEGLETVVGALAVVMVTYMVVWMRKHSRELKGSLEGAAAQALATQSSKAGRALVLMAFLAVLREGFETVVFLLAAFNENGSGALAGVGAALGIAVAVALGWGIYRGGVTLNLSKFFRATGLVLVLVAAGLVVTAFHTAHEAGWLNSGQGSTVDLTWLVHPGSVQSSLLTGMLGVQPRPVVIEVIGWLVFVVPVGLYVAWPAGRSIAPQRLAIGCGAAAAVLGATAVALVVAAPTAPPTAPTSTFGSAVARVLSTDGSTAVVRVQGLASPAVSTVSLHRTGAQTEGGLTVMRYTARSIHPTPATHPTPTTQPTPATHPTTHLPSTLSDRRVAQLNGGRLPLGIGAGTQRIRATYSSATTTTALIEPNTLRVIAVGSETATTATVHSAVGAIPLDHAIGTASSVTARAATARELQNAHVDLRQLDRRSDRHDLAAVAGALGIALLIVALSAAAVALRRTTTPPLDSAPSDLVRNKVSLT
jgi:high-affinity iron transporter